MEGATFTSPHPTLRAPLSIDCVNREGLEVIFLFGMNGFKLDGEAFKVEVDE
jgi:phosphotransferase system IIA component